MVPDPDLPASASVDWSAYGLAVVDRPVPLPPGYPADIGAALRGRAERDPDREALVGRHSRYSFAALDRAIDAAAAALAGRGVQPGVRVAASARNDPDIVIAFHAAQRLGAVWVGVNRQLSDAEKLFQLGDCGVSVYLADEASALVARELRPRLPALATIIDMEPGRADNAWRGLLRAHDGEAPPPIAIDRHAPAAIGYTSGTTGVPKGVVHSQHNLLVATAAIEAPGVTRQGCVMQLTILNVMMNHGLGALRAGTTLVCIDRSDAGGILDWVEAERVDGFRAPSPVVYDLLTRSDLATRDLAGLVYLATAGGPASAALRELYERRFGRRMLDGYGLTEAPGIVTHFTPDDTPRDGAIGRPAPHLEVAVLDERGEPLPDGAIGEICVRAARDGAGAGVYTPMLGYWRQPDATREALRGGWLHTGDLGHRDADGMFFLSARGKDMILRGGANIYPREIERVIHEDPRVREACAFGLPDERLGQIVAVAVEVEDGVDGETLKADLVARLSETLAGYKRPEVWLIADSLPRNGMGKIERHTVRELAARGRSRRREDEDRPS